MFEIESRGIIHFSNIILRLMWWNSITPLRIFASHILQCTSAILRTLSTFEHCLMHMRRNRIQCGCILAPCIPHLQNCLGMVYFLTFFYSHVAKYHFTSFHLCISTSWQVSRHNLVSSIFLMPMWRNNVFHFYMS